MEATFKEISVVVSVDPLAVEIVFGKASFVNIFIAKFQDSDAMFHTTAPVAFVLCSREEIISPIAIYLIINEATRVFLTWLIVVNTPSIFDALFHLSLVYISILVFDLVVIVAKVSLLNLFEAIVELLRIVGVFFRVCLYNLQLFLALTVFLMNRLFNDLIVIFIICILRLSLCLLLVLRRLDLKELSVINMAIFKELLGVLMKLFLAYLISDLENLSIEHGFSMFSH